MKTMYDRDALQLIADRWGESRESILTAARDAGFSDDAQNIERIGDLYARDLIQGTPASLTLTPQGLERLKELCEEAIDKAKKEKQQRFGNKLAVLSLLVSLVSFLAGLIVEHQVGVVENVVQIVVHIYP